METFVKESRVLTSAHIHQKITLFSILTDAVYIIHYEALIQDFSVFCPSMIQSHIVLVVMRCP